MNWPNSLKKGREQAVSAGSTIITETGARMRKLWYTTLHRLGGTKEKVVCFRPKKIGNTSFTHEGKEKRTIKAGIKSKVSGNEPDGWWNNCPRRE